MAKPKITRLGDPANPYTKRKVTAEQARASAKALGVKAKPKPKADPPAKKRKASEPTGILGRARRATLDRQIKQAGG